MYFKCWYWWPIREQAEETGGTEKERGRRKKKIGGGRSKKGTRSHAELCE